MQRENKLSDVGWISKFYDGLRKNNRLLNKIVLVCALCWLWSIVAVAESGYTVEGIAETLLATEAKFTNNLRVEYIATGGSLTDVNNLLYVAEVTYAEKKPSDANSSQRLRYLDVTNYSIDSRTGKENVIWSTLTCFDGEATTILHREIKPGEPMKAVISPGYNPNMFSLTDGPHKKTWYFGGKLLGEILKENKNTFQFESESELRGGVSAVKLTGTIWDGKVSMKLWVSPEHDFMPLKLMAMRTDDGATLGDIGLYEPIQLPNGIWYPKIIRNPDIPSTTARGFTVWDVSRISIEPIPEEFFKVEFPPNTHVDDAILNVSYTTY